MNVHADVAHTFHSACLWNSIKEPTDYMEDHRDSTRFADTEDTRILDREPQPHANNCPCCRRVIHRCVPCVAQTPSGASVSTTDDEKTEDDDHETFEMSIARKWR